MRTILAVATAAIAVAGCGAGKDPSPEQQVRDTVTGLLAAAADGDGQGVCDRLEDGLRERLVFTAGPGGGQGNCDSLAKALTDGMVTSQVKVHDVDISGDTARATTTTQWGGGVVELRHEDDAWLVSVLPDLGTDFSGPGPSQGQ